MSAIDWIRLEELRFEALVGILPSEQTRAQPLDLEIEMGLDMEACAATGDLTKSVNYAEVAEATRFIAQQGRWRLIESLSMAILRNILAPARALEGRADVEIARVRIAKPTILGDLATPAVRFERRAGLPIQTVSDGGLTIETLEATPLSAAYRVHLSEGAVFHPAPGMALRVVAGEIRVGDTVVSAGGELARLTGPIRSRTEGLLIAVGAPL